MGTNPDHEIQFSSPQTCGGSAEHGSAGSTVVPPSRASLGAPVHGPNTRWANRGGYPLAAQPEIRQVWSDVNDVAQSTKVFAKTTEGLPKLINDQREAAISQVLAGVPVAGSILMASLLSEEEKVSGLLVESRQTLNAGGQMATRSTQPSGRSTRLCITFRRRKPISALIYSMVLPLTDCNPGVNLQWQMHDDWYAMGCGQAGRLQACAQAGAGSSIQP